MFSKFSVELMNRELILWKTYMFGVISSISQNFHIDGLVYYHFLQSTGITNNFWVVIQKQEFHALVICLSGFRIQVTSRNAVKQGKNRPVQMMFNVLSSKRYITRTFSLQSCCHIFLHYCSISVSFNHALALCIRLLAQQTST